MFHCQSGALHLSRLWSTGTRIGNVMDVVNILCHSFILQFVIIFFSPSCLCSFNIFSVVWEQLAPASLPAPPASASQKNWSVMAGMTVVIWATRWSAVSSRTTQQHFFCRYSFPYFISSSHMNTYLPSWERYISRENINTKPINAP